MDVEGLPGRGLEELGPEGEVGGREDEEGGVEGRFWKGRWMLMKAATAWTCGEDWAWLRK